MNNKEWFVLPGLMEVFTYYLQIAKAYLTNDDPVMNRPLLIIGDSGVGKGMFIEAAKQIFLNKNPSKEVIRLNCASFEKNLIDSELFGYVKGAFTGAVNDEKGIVEAAKGGLLILDGIGEIPKELQAKLLIFIEENEYRKVGSSKINHSFVKIIGTTNRQKKDFRNDFWYRFFPVFIPPLYERRLDLIYYILLKYKYIASKLTPLFVMRLLSHNWPGNVRELERVISFIRLNCLQHEEAELGEFSWWCSPEFPMSDEDSALETEKFMFDEEITVELNNRMITFPEDERQTAFANSILNNFAAQLEKSDFDLLGFNKKIREYGLQFPYYFDSEKEALKHDKCIAVSTYAKKHPTFQVDDQGERKQFKRTIFSCKMPFYNHKKEKFEMGFWDNYYEKLADVIELETDSIEDLDGFYEVVDNSRIENIGNMLKCLCLFFLKNEKNSENIFGSKKVYINSTYRRNRSFASQAEVVKKFLFDALDFATESSAYRPSVEGDDYAANWRSYVDVLTNYDDKMFDVELLPSDFKRVDEINEDFVIKTERQLLGEYYTFLKDQFKTDKKASEAAGLNESTFRFRMKKYSQVKND
ncbi:sigma 54-interacting transcriptional regulator [Desulfovibrio sp. JY]|nr:sigma 54-interacting transcriptional regulator [Desulfovibrio sp. JY]